ncbi:uncharacterized protein LOC131659717 [Vicia villosa]|uniref:uncharacterized protein LOC131659717 n=1 Tax=Vicia villosa TaxID=3911 RepID=UPI00273B63CD|nr:uncharacterized protein LOC131659717 [Vicia villosa]
MVRTVAFIITQYWMQCLPLPKFVIHNINNVYRSFIWTGGHEVKRKSLVAWSKVCRPISQGGINIPNLEGWSKVAMLKCLWNICNKFDNLWDDTFVPWRYLIRRNRARPKEIITLCLVCHGRIATKDRLMRYGMLQDNICSLCKEHEESIHHLFFKCSETKPIWQAVLNWLEITHVPKGWLEEKPWLLQYTKRKGWKAKMMKIAVPETMHEIWLYINGIIF